ncbi:uncharacterized protein LOC132876098 isoform X2 [Neoarius graeffei]|uniref:uncharacterized protein LOC132876098 isoform X2 n=1 Tax=Neoarius graeffei TaxID=443677 RepID=UPI00298CF4B9|nr:uncharacterized protein LOC132876098 isoform X2 [Neoarius graeffei]
MRVLFFSMICFSVWMLWCGLKFVKGGVMCPNSCTDRSNISVKLQSDVLLPCSFNPTLLGSDKTADIAVVWSQRNTTSHNLLEILLKGEVRPWNNKGGCIKAFPELSESGNFSILLEKVQPYDVGLYSCELFNGTNCSIAYQEIQLGLAKFVFSWAIIITGASAGAVLLCFFIASVFYISKKRKHQPHPENTCRSSHDNPIYVSYTGHSKEAALESENPIYDTVWNRGSSM